MMVWTAQYTVGNKFYTTSFHCYYWGNPMIVASCCIHVTCTDLEQLYSYSELSTSTKFSCIECTNNPNVSFIYYQ